MKAPLPLLKRAAIESAHRAGAVLVKHFGRKLRISEKKGAGLVTNADIEAEEAAIRVLRRATPSFTYLAEESSPTQEHGDGRWIIDPLDGTTNYVHRFPMFCVSIGAEWEGRIVVGVIHHPLLKQTYVGVRGHGATLNGKRISVSATRKLGEALLTTGFTYRRGELLHAEMQAFERLSAAARAVRRPGSAALDLAYTACGVFDGFWERRLSPWDMAAGSVIIEEAGGKVTDFEGRPFQVDTQEILATNPHLHAPLLRILSKPASSA